MIKQDLTIIGDTELDFTLIKYMKSGFKNIPSFYEHLVDRKGMEYYFDLVVKITGVTPEQLMSKERERHINTARKIFMATAYWFTKEKLYTIGVRVNRDHSTVIHAVNSLELDYSDWRDSFGFVRGWIDKLTDHLQVPATYILRQGNRLPHRVLG